MNSVVNGVEEGSDVASGVSLPVTTEQTEVSSEGSYISSLNEVVLQVMHNRPLMILGLSTGVAAATALVIKLMGNKANKKKAALRAGLLTAAVSTGYYYGPDMFYFLTSCVKSSS